MRPNFLAATAAFSLLSSITVATAGTATADLNDLVEGQMSHATAGLGQAGGTGFDPDANNTWSNTGTISAIPGDLTAPTSTNYSYVQGAGTALSAQGTFTAGRQATRALAAPLTGSTVWFSFLLNQPTTESRGGITFNQNGFSPAEPRIVATGGDLRLSLSTIQVPGGGANGVIPIGETVLILGRVTIDTFGGDEVLDVWVNPDVSNGVAGLPAPTNTLTQEAATFDTGIERVGIQSYSSDTLGGIVDALIVSDEPNAFEIVAPSSNDPDEPNLLVSPSNPFGGEVIPPETDPVTIDLNISNSATAEILTIADTSAISGTDAANFTLLTALPISLNPGDDTTLQIRFDSPGTAGAFAASLDLDSNDESSATISIPLLVTVPPILEVTGSDPFGGLSFQPDPAPVTGSIQLTNNSTTTTITIAASSAITGNSNFTLLTSVPFDLLPGQSTDVEMQFDATGGGPLFAANLQIDSNDPGNEAIVIPLSATVPLGGVNLIENGDFEEDGDEFSNWFQGGPAEPIQPGLNGSSIGANIASSGFAEQSIFAAEDWYCDFFFQAQDTFERAINVRIFAPGGQLNVRYRGTSAGAENTWNAYVEDWGVDLGLDDVQPGATYMMRIVGHNWGTDTPTYDLFLSAPNSTALVSKVEGLDRYQGGTPNSPPTGLRFTAEFGNSPGFIVDDVRFVNGPPPPDEPLRITEFTWDPDMGVFSFKYAAQVGVSYSIEASDDLFNWLELDDPTAENPVETYTETGVSVPRRFYRILELE